MHKKTTAVSVLLTLSIGAFAADYYVAPNATGDYSYGNPGPPPWGAAEKATQAGDVIHLAAGTYSYTTGNITVKPGVTMIGATENPEDTVIERIKQPSDKNNRCINLGRNAVLRNLTVRGGYTDYQAATVLGYDTAVHKVFSVSNCIFTASADGKTDDDAYWCENAICIQASNEQLLERMVFENLALASI